MRGLIVTLLFGPLALFACRPDPDRELERRVLQALDGTADAQRVGVWSGDGIVRLSGVVSGDRERMRIENEARRVPGVLCVDNRIVVPEALDTK